MLRLFLNKFIFAFVRVDCGIHSGKYRRATVYQVFVFEACAREKKSSVGDAHRVFLRVVEIQRRKVRQYSKICVTLLFKTSKLSESEIPVQFVYPDSVFESPPICPRTNIIHSLIRSLIY